MKLQASPVSSHAEEQGLSLRSVLDVERQGDEDRFIGLPGAYSMPMLYGGHLLGQGVAAALKTVGSEFFVNSLHAYFLRAGQQDHALEYRVSRIRDGRRYGTRMVQAFQQDKLLLTMMVSVKIPETGDEHCVSMPVVKSPETLISVREQAGRSGAVFPMSAYGVRIEPLDDYHPATPDFGAAKIQQWLKVSLPVDASLHVKQSALAYLSDGTLMFNALRPYGSLGTSHAATSLDHSVWFHHQPDLSDWLLFDQSSPSATDARGLNQGRLFARDGKLLATVMQESMLKRQ